MPTTPSKETQAAEGAAREQAGTAIPPNETVTALDTGAEGAPQRSCWCRTCASADTRSRHRRADQAGGAQQI